MPLNNDHYSSSSFSSSSSSSQLSTSPRALQYGPPSQTIVKSPLWDVKKAKCSFGFSMPKSNEELKEEIAELETEIIELERYLLKLYRASFGNHLPALSLPDDSSQCPKSLPLKPIKYHNDSVSSMSDMSVSTTFKTLSEMDKIKRSDSGNPSLADLLGLNTLSPNKLSEDILRLICVIYLNLSDNSRLFKKNSKNEHELVVVINKLILDDDNLKSVESMLRNFRLLVQKLEKVDPERLTREEKLAFWINIHNTLVMHAYIVYGVYEDTTSTMILKLIQAAFNIGGEWIDAYDVQSSIFGIRPCESPSRLRTLFSPAKSLKRSYRGHIYALDYEEPLLHFALSTGESIDPTVQVYTAEGVFTELRQARDGFIRTSIGFEKETKILLPKVIYNYAKDRSLDMAELFNIISECLTETQRTTMRRVVKKKQDQCIHWISRDSSFRYVIQSELLRGSLGI